MEAEISILCNYFFGFQDTFPYVTNVVLGIYENTQHDGFVSLAILFVVEKQQQMNEKIVQHQKRLS
jgi:hypothetical protein